MRCGIRRNCARNDVYDFGEAAAEGAAVSGGRAIGMGAVVGAGIATGAVAGFGNEISSRIASFAKMLSRYCEMIVSQTRRASSLRFFAFKKRHLGEERERRIETLRILGREPLIGAERFVVLA